MTGSSRLPKRAVRQYPRNSANKQPVACPTIAIDRGPCAKRPVVPLSILRTHWINERRLCAAKACLLATSQTALAIAQGVRLRCNHMGGRNWWQDCNSVPEKAAAYRTTDSD